ncbi:hypothetical protein D9M69_610650 [compost metagenome]
MGSVDRFGHGFFACGQAHAPVATVFLDELQQVVGLDHVKQARVAECAGRKSRISTLQVLPQGAQGNLALAGPSGEQGHCIYNEPRSAFDSRLGGRRLGGFGFQTGVRRGGRFLGLLCGFFGVFVSAPLEELVTGVA